MKDEVWAGMTNNFEAVNQPSYNPGTKYSPEAYDLVTKLLNFLYEDEGFSRDN